MRIKNLLPTTYLLIALVLTVILHFAQPIIKLIPVPWNLLGLIPFMIGILINLMADGALHKADTTVKPFQESNALVTGSVYRICRHPMYLGFVLLLIGAAITLGSLSPWLIIPIFIALMESLFIRTEERMLEAKFGAAWLDYKGKVRRWI
jgi:protein-S-isoprenylcysteine O-methyltransferase Ste14